MAVGTVNHDAPPILWLSLPEISESSRHQIDGLGAFKAEYLNQGLTLGSSHPILGPMGWDYMKGGIWYPFFQAENKSNLPKNGPVLAFFG
jgi:hypothetical protein